MDKLKTENIIRKKKKKKLYLPWTFELADVFYLIIPRGWQTRLLITLGTLSKDVFERRTSTGSEALSLFICLDANKLVLLSFFSLLKTIYPRVSTKPLPNDAKSPLPVDVRPSKTLLLKLPIIQREGGGVNLMGGTYC